LSSNLNQPDMREGIVIRSTGGHCLVVSDGETWRCKFRGKLKKGPRKAQTLAVVGDKVTFLVLDEKTDPKSAVVEQIHERRNKISRMAARRSGSGVEQVLMANLDQVIAVQSLREPAPQKGFVDRLLVAAERFGVGGVLVLNKCDLAEDPSEKSHYDYYSGLGYEVLFTSAETEEGVDRLEEILTDKISLLIGASGVGKSTLLNVMQPGLQIRVGEVTEKTGLGRHTTTSTELYPLENGGFIADSPGIRGFDPWDIDPLDVRDFFPDFGEPSLECRFRSCLHRDEPACGVKTAMARGLIPSWRHAAYLALLGDLEERKAKLGYQR
jgi:ribosome biogenesis GTPase / thiamine phosphate phosphatase